MLRRTTRTVFRNIVESTVALTEYSQNYYPIISLYERKFGYSRNTDEIEADGQVPIKNFNPMLSIIQCVVFSKLTHYSSKV